MTNKQSRKTPTPPGAKPRLQMVDIAKMAGVSTATVSRALNDSPLVTPETRARIAELARSMNYTINAGAKHLRLGQNKTVALVLPYERDSRQSVSDPFFLSMFGAIADALTERGYDMLVSRVDASELDCAAQLYNAGRAMGIILIGQWRHHEQLKAMAERGVPLVVWGAQMTDGGYCTVGCDNIAGGELATEHLIACGRRRIAFIGDTVFPEVAQRMEGYRRALARHGIVADERLSIAASFLADGARQAMAELKRRQAPFDAVFACSDLLALTAIGALEQQGLKVSRDVSVVGYDDVAMASYFHLPLTTVRQDIEAGGRELVAALIERIGHQEPASRVVATELVIRETSRVPAA